MQPRESLPLERLEWLIQASSQTLTWSITDGRLCKSSTRSAIPTTVAKMRASKATSNLDRPKADGLHEPSRISPRIVVTSVATLRGPQPLLRLMPNFFIRLRRVLGFRLRA